jgi:hypothetical protein
LPRGVNNHPKLVTQIQLAKTFIGCQNGLKYQRTFQHHPLSTTWIQISVELNNILRSQTTQSQTYFRKSKHLGKQISFKIRACYKKFNMLESDKVLFLIRADFASGFDLILNSLCLGMHYGQLLLIRRRMPFQCPGLPQVVLSPPLYGISVSWNNWR